MIELLGVVLVLGLIAGLVSINWRAMVPRSELNGAVRELAATIQGARSDAIARNAEFRLIYDIDANSYEVTSPFRLGGGRAVNDEERLVVRRGKLPKGIEIRRVVIDGVSYESERVAVRFDPLGRSSEHAVVLARDEYGWVFTVEVLGLTGLIRFHEGEFFREPLVEEDF